MDGQEKLVNNSFSEAITCGTTCLLYLPYVLVYPNDLFQRIYWKGTTLKKTLETNNLLQAFFLS